MAVCFVGTSIILLLLGIEIDVHIVERVSITLRKLHGKVITTKINYM